MVKFKFYDKTLKKYVPLFRGPEKVWDARYRAAKIEYIKYSQIIQNLFYNMRVSNLNFLE